MTKARAKYIANESLRLFRMMGHNLTDKEVNAFLASVQMAVEDNDRQPHVVPASIQIWDNDDAN